MSTTITGLPAAATPLDGNELVPMDQAGATKEATTQDIANLAAGTDLSYVAITRVLTSSTGDNATLPLAGANAGLMSAADKDRLDGIATGAEVNVNADWNASGGDAQILNKPTLGTAAALDVAAAGDASSGQVVKGNDSRLSDSRTPTAHTQAASTISDSTTAGRALLTAADAAAQRTSLGLGTAATSNSTAFAASGAITSSGLTQATARLLGRATAGTGAPEEITLGSNLSFSGTTLNAAGSAPGGSSGQLQWNSSGAFAGLSSSSIDGSGNLTLSARYIGSLNATASAPPWSLTGTWFTGGTATTTKPQVLIEPTGTTSTTWSTSGTGLGVNAASGFAGNLLDLQVNGTSQARITSAGRLIPTSLLINNDVDNGFIGLAANQLTFGASNSNLFSIGLRYGVDTDILKASAAGGFGWSNVAGSTNNADLVLRRDAAGTLAQRNGTNAQAFRVYNTYTSGTNYELGKLEWSGNVFRIGTEKGSGGGTARTVEVHTDSVSRLALDTTGSVRVVTGLTVATLPGTPAVGMIARVTDATAPAVGSTVAGGGAAAALVWYNGTNWRVIGV